MPPTRRRSLTYGPAAVLAIRVMFGAPTWAQTTDSDDARTVARVEAAIKGREAEPASAVFTNVRSVGTIPAGRLLRIMQMGYAQSLGVSCAHCHDLADLASDAKDAKRIAREMVQLVNDINARLQASAALKPRSPVVNCTTCHRGALKPALSLAPPPPQE